MKILLDMNLSPRWIQFFAHHGINAVHWSTIGKLNARDDEVFSWARENNYIIFTHDLDFGTILSNTQDNSPSVIQIRTQNINPDEIGDAILSALHNYQDHFVKGAIATISNNKTRIRILPLNK
jgi:predicted nuclease of predicted toxin-antitoxin system